MSGTSFIAATMTAAVVPAELRPGRVAFLMYFVAASICVRYLMSHSLNDSSWLRFEPEKSRPMRLAADRIVLLVQDMS